MASLTITLQVAPDLRALLDYAERTLGRFCESPMLTDPRVVDVISDARATIARPDIVEIDRAASPWMLLPGDELLRLVAKMRAVERVVFSGA